MISGILDKELPDLQIQRGAGHSVTRVDHGGVGVHVFWDTLYAGVGGGIHYGGAIICGTLYQEENFKFYDTTLEKRFLILLKLS